jgi:hypothetical protein
MGELSSMISWVERVLALALMASTGVVKAAPSWVEDGLGVKVEENRGVAWNWRDPLAPCGTGV